VFPLVFVRLIQEGWITAADLKGLEEEKLKAIKHIISLE
jgi:hypothetical protein